jgi:hypothetical protein
VFAIQFSSLLLLCLLGLYLDFIVSETYNFFFAVVTMLGLLP